MRKSQLYSHIFIYVLTIVLISLILAYGYKSIIDFKSRADKISCLKFMNDLRGAVDGILSDYGSARRKDLYLCNNYNKVCFVETFELSEGAKKNPQARDQDGNTISIDPIIKDSIKSNAGKDVFLIDRIAKESFYAGNISVDGDVLCIDARNNKISLRLEGFGNRVLLNEWR